jgi:uncharacterized UPF0160 family protein
MTELYPTYATLINQQESDLLTFCDYLDWAYVSYVDLNDAGSLEEIRTNVCASFVQDLNFAQKAIDETNQHFVSQGFLTKLS